MSNESLIVKYRPKNFGEVIGQDKIVKSFQRALDEYTSHAFCFTGPSGTGKTTLARIGAAYVGTEPKSLKEIAAAVHNGVDDMRALEDELSHRPLYGSVKSIIVDECHMLSRAAWNSILKLVEEPPEWVYWFFCTTEPNRVIDTIKQRCTFYTLNQVPNVVLFDYLADIAKKERFETLDTVIELCVRNAYGSPRRALANLSAAWGADSREEALLLIQNNEVIEGGAAVRLARALTQTPRWDKIQPILVELSEEENFSPENVRHIIRAYYTKVILGTAKELPDEQTVCNALRILDQFLEFFNSNDGISPLVAAVGRVIFNKGPSK